MIYLVVFEAIIINNKFAKLILKSNWRKRKQTDKFQGLQVADCDSSG